MDEIRVERRTSETNISLSLRVDGEGVSEVRTPLPFFNHMLESFTRFGRFNLRLDAEGDVDVDAHHTVEDIGIVLGEAVRKARGDGVGINRIGHILLPMDDALVAVAIDLCGRVFLSISPEIKGTVGGFDASLIKEFLRGFCSYAGCVLHIRVLAGDNTHHICEAVFKALGTVLSQALSKDSRLKNRPLSTKEKL